MSTPVYLDLVAMVAPALSLWLLFRQKPSFVGIARDNLIRLNIYFFLILVADIDRILTQSVIATYVMLIGFFSIATNFGHAAAVVQFCPEARDWRESMRIILKRTMLFPIFLLILGAWLVVTLAFDPVTSSLTYNPVPYPSASIITAPCPDLVYSKHSPSDAVRLALFSHFGAGDFLPLVTSDSVLLRAGPDYQFRALLPVSSISSDSPWNN